MPRDLFEENGINPNSNQGGVDLFALNGIDPSAQNVAPQNNGYQLPSPGSLDQLVNSAPMQFVRGAGDATQHFMANLLNLIPGVNAPMAQTGEGTAYDIGGIAGDIGTFLVPMGATTKALSYAKEIPALSSAAASLLGKGIMPAIGRNAIAGGMYGAVMNPDDRLKGAAIDSALSGAGGGLGEAISALRPSRLFRGKLTPEQLQENVRLTQGTNTGLGDVVGSPYLKRQYENVLSRVLGGGVDDLMHDTATQVKGSGEDLMKQMLGGNNPKDIGSALQNALKDAKSQVTRESDKNYRMVDELARSLGVTVAPENFSKTAQNILEDMSKSKRLADKVPSSLKSELQSYANSTDIDPLKQSNIFKGILGDQASESGKAGNRYEAGIYNKLRTAVKKDLDESIQNSGNEQLKNLHASAENFYKENMVPFEDPDLAKFIRKGGDPDLIISHFVKTGQNDRSNLLSKLVQNIEPQQKGLIPYGFFSRAIKDGELDPSRMSTLYRKLGPEQQELIFSNPAMKKSMDDYVKLTAMNSKPLNRMFNPQTGHINADLIIPTLLTHGLGSYGGYEAGGLPGAIAGGALGLGGGALLSKYLSKALTNEKTREAFVKKMIKDTGKDKSGFGVGEAISSALGGLLGQRIQQR